ncbi:AAA family ATPase [uncultured Cellulomonas sp.]|uniref:AAA family ATPase n=1 Tax=uncultured Cellulomonas sp. TaxID=189682 RepID=UPI00261404B6|nr:MoxR family ATPase [uncultured Cellulomonas sp.]
MSKSLPAIARQSDPLLTVLRAAGRAGVSTLLWGPPGAGKSSLFESLARSEGLPMETVIASLREPSDFAGLPVIRDHGVELAPPAWAQRLAEAEDGYLFLDELTTAPPAVQAALLRVVLDRAVGDLVLPRGIRVVAAANPPDQAADGWDLPAPQANRFLHLTYTPSLDGWLDGMTTGFGVPVSGRVLDYSPVTRAATRAQVASFIRTRPDLLHAFPRDDASAGRAWPSRRTWTMTADVLAMLDPDDTPATLLAASGLVGEGAAVEFIAWRQDNDLPDPADVLADPTTVAWADLEPSRAWAILTAVTAHATADRTKTGWAAAWKPLAVAATAGLQDVAAANARALLRSRPKDTYPPASAKAFLAVLADAGLITTGEQA